MKVKNYTAYLIDGNYYIRRGKPSEKIKKQIIPVIQENKKDSQRRKILKTVYCNRLVYGWEEETKITQAGLPFNN